MSSTAERLLKRSCCPVTINGEEFYVGGLTINERKQVDQIESPITKNFFAVACGLREKDGTVSFPRSKDETHTDYAARIEQTLGDIETDTLIGLAKEVGRIGKVPKQEVIAKN